MTGLFDCDNHLYEPADAVTRYLPKDMLDRAITPITLANGEEGLLAGGRLVTGLDHPIDKAHRPGALREMLRSMKSGQPTEGYSLQDLRPEYLERAPRLALMDEQGIESTILYPATMGTMAEHYVRGVKPLYANVHAYNLWLNETWGFNHADRIYTPAVLSLRDLDSAVAELEFVLAAGAKLIMLNAGPAYGRSPGDPYFDPFWSRMNEAGASVAFHIGEFYYNENLAPAWGLDPEPVFFEMTAWQWMHCWGERPIQETLSALIFDNLFGRFPNIHAVASEFGAEWVPHFVRHMDKSRGMGRRGQWIGGKLPEKPSLVFQQHVRVTPYPEDDVVKIVTDLGQCDSIVMGSDFPHGEGFARPAEFGELVADLPADVQQKILHDNALVLVGRT
ncbi:MAG: amidohydrolase [Actinomycetia bacterium]|nr:amidohydrolase [Actinomycetes bacterium]